MKLLLHICCGPCAAFPVQEIRSRGISLTGYFFNHNIHPFQEYRQRIDAVRKFAEQVDLEIMFRDEYRLDQFLASVAAAPDRRCSYCYASRLEAAAEYAAKEGFTAFSSTLLYSRYQNHDEIKKLGKGLAERFNIEFYYEDFRQGWQEGIQLSKQMGLYRQQYCGCIYSERDRYLTDERRF